MRGRPMPEGKPRQTIFIVDDDRGLLLLMEKVLRRAGFDTKTASTGNDALAWLADHKADLLLLDLKLQDSQGQELIRHLGELPSPPPFVIITGQGDERVAVEMMKRGARDYLIKDADYLQFVPEVVRNVLGQVETEQRLEAAEERVRLVESVVERGFSAVLIASSDVPDPTVLYINPSFAQLTGYSREQAVGRPLSALSGMPALHEWLRRAVSSKARFLEEISAFTTPRGERWGEWRVEPMKDRSGRITQWLIILPDITDRKRLEKEILEIRDREQRRLGQDLHDGLCQELAGIELMSQALEQKIASRSRSDAARAGEIAGHVREAIRQTRLLARGLSPLMRESDGLMSALQELALNTGKMFRVDCRFECASSVLVRDQATATHLFRIAQEAVSNALKHGKAEQITIGLGQQDEGPIRLVIEDSGQGFPDPLPSGRGMGLRIMESRAGMIGGTLATGNRPQGGARVACEVLIAQQKQTSEHRVRKTKKSKNPQPGPDH